MIARFARFTLEMSRVFQINYYLKTIRMRKILSILLIAVLCTCATNSLVTAQYADKNYLVSVDKIKSYLEFEKKLEAEGISDPKEITTRKGHINTFKASGRATANFKKHFKDASAVKWSLNDEVIVASFTNDEVRTNVVYDKKGRWINTLRYTYENTMPKQVRSIINDVYPGFDVNLCVEIHENNLIFHIVQIESKKEFKQLGIYDGEINILKEYEKNHQ